MDQNSSLGQAYDFKSKAGITAILVALRKSEISSAEKNELRDLVFLYTSGGGDESVRISLEQKLKSHNVKPVVVEVIPPPPDLPFGTFRPTPTFKNLTVTKPAPVEPVAVVKEVVPPTTPATNVKIAEPSIPAPVAVTPPSVPSQPAVTNSVSINKVVASVEQSTVQTQGAPDVVVPPVIKTPSPVAQPVIPIINTKYLDRIREIKSAVNAKVGNPVNLVDIDNQVGREYMNALLEAMKRLNGGVAGELDLAMQRLETAYLAVEQVVNARSVENTNPEPVASVQKDAVVPPISPIPSEPKVVEAPVFASTPSLSPKPPIAEPVASVVSPEVPTPASSPLPLNNAPSISAGINLASMGEVVAQTPPAVKPVVSAPIPSPYIEKPVISESVSGFSSTKFEGKIPTLAEERKMPTFNDVPSVLPTNANEITNPLYTSEIDAGLDQLLSDWSLFKKSGLFGSGPKGREHPLFKKISGLQIPLLLAGRFEGANQEIRQSITDYMNGWRYEQGIIYEQGETFETYLRRVIRHIIDLQKRRIPA